MIYHRDHDQKVVGWWWLWLYQTAYRGLSKPRWYVVHIDLPTKGTAQGFATKLRWKNSEFVVRYCQSIPKSQPWLLLFNVIPIRFSWWKHSLSPLDDRWLMVAPRLSEFCGFGVRSSQRIQRRGFQLAAFQLGASTGKPLVTKWINPRSFGVTMALAINIGSCDQQWLMIVSWVAECWEAPFQAVVTLENHSSLDH